MKKNFTILITTKNRLESLKITLKSLAFSISDVELIICVDGSTDGTYEYLKKYYPHIKVIKNRKSKGLIYSRNILFDLVRTPFAISLDDDANFLSESPFNIIHDFFIKNPTCGVICFRIYWGIIKPYSQISTDNIEQVKGFVGCGHAWRMKSWKDIPDYPSWFIFYGEEEFASYHLFKRNWGIYYLPEILVHHRVDNRSRKENKDSVQRRRRSLRAGWYLYIMFLPLKRIPKKMLYSIWMQLKLKVFKGDGETLIVILQAVLDLLIHLPKIIRNRQPLTNSEHNAYLQLPDTKFYWKPEN